MDAKTLKALRGSIKKWRLIAAGTGKDLGPDNCPLCELFFWPNCRGCPVKRRTKRENCENTPYQRWSELMDMSSRKARTPEQFEAARAEVKFLKSLLPRKR